MIAEDLIGRAVFVARRPGVLAGLPAAALVVQAIDSRLRFDPLLADGSLLEPGQRLATLAGSMRSILACERIALNFLQHLSGVASLTRKYVDAAAGFAAKILDTRKTLPGWRLLQKYAVRCGGGHNHRMGLFDGILIKDNHLAAYPSADSRCADRPGPATGPGISQPARLGTAISGNRGGKPGAAGNGPVLPARHYSARQHDDRNDARGGGTPQSTGTWG